MSGVNEPHQIAQQRSAYPKEHVERNEEAQQEEGVEFAQAAFFFEDTEIGVPNLVLVTKDGLDGILERANGIERHF